MAVDNSAMPLKILIVPDKFKGTLTAAEAAAVIARGWRAGRPGDALTLVPMSDGGDGFGEVLSTLLGAEVRAVQTVDAAHRPVQAHWWWHEPTRMAVVESARVIGLAMLPRGKYHPFDLDTLGLAAVLQAAAAQGAGRCCIGIGGSATNDGGFGLARGLGWEFLDEDGERILAWTELSRLAALRPPARPRLFEELIVAVDVQNPLLGQAGCSRVYGPQKGLTEFDAAERALSRMAEVVQAQSGANHALTPGAGAAGGLGFGLLAFAGARVESGFAVFERHARLTERIRAADLVVTGEGALDAQTVMGKGVGEVADLCLRLGVPCFGLAGVVTDPAQAQTKFKLARGLTELTEKETALANPGYWLEELARRVAVAFKDEA